MKTILVRAAVMTLTVAGLMAPAMTPAKTASPTKTVTNSWGSMPTPLCLPSSGNVCGMQ